MSYIDYPDVPDVPGVPQIPRQPDNGQQVDTGNAVNTTSNLPSFQTQSNWGIYDADGNVLGDPNLYNPDGNEGGLLSTHSIEFSKKMRISEFPVEQGTFANYNKVELPANPVITLVYGGSEQDRSEFLRQIEVATDVTDLYSIVTPEVTYINFSVESYDYKRSSEGGVSMLTVRITLKQIRQVSAQFTSSTAQIREPVNDDATAEKDNGKVQSGQPDDATKKAVTKKVPGL